MAAWPVTSLLLCVQPAPEQTELYLRQPGNLPGFLGERVIQSIWEKWGLLPCILASCLDNNLCGLTLNGQWGCCREQIQFMLCWIKMYSLVMVQNLEPHGLSWQCWHDSAKCQTASGAFLGQLGSIRAYALWVVQFFREDLMWRTRGWCAADLQSVTCMFTSSSAAEIALLHLGSSFTSYSTEEEFFWNKSLWKQKKFYK